MARMQQFSCKNCSHSLEPTKSLELRHTVKCPACGSTAVYDPLDWREEITLPIIEPEPSPRLYTGHCEECGTTLWDYGVCPLCPTLILERTAERPRMHEYPPNWIDPIPIEPVSRPVLLGIICLSVIALFVIILAARPSPTPKKVKATEDAYHHLRDLQDAEDDAAEIYKETK